MNIIEYFNNVKIINLVSRVDRRKETEIEFKQNNFIINTPTVNFFDAIKSENSEGFPNSGTRGCFLSHMKILEDASNYQLNNILILEDDISFSKNIAKYGIASINSLKDLNWDILYFGHALESSIDEITWKEVKKPMLLAHFYAVNGKTLPRLVEFLHVLLDRPAGHPEGGPMHYDGALNTFMKQNPDVKAYYFSKNLGYQRPSKTDLHQVTIFDTNIVLQQILKVYRKFKRRYLKYTF